jgi:hypothetical protein
MASGLGLVTAVAVTGSVVAAEAERVLPGGVLMVHDETGMVQYFDADGRKIMSVFPSQAIVTRVQVDVLAGGGTTGLDWWTDVTIPYGDARTAVNIASAIAATCGGRAVWPGE